MIWPHATTQHPCPVCAGTDWCTFGDKAMLCQRVESDHPAEKGGHYHFYETATPHQHVHTERKKAPPRQIDAESLMRSWRSSTVMPGYIALAASLGVIPEALIALGAAYAQEKAAWAFPMRDGDGNIIGIRLRNFEGFKWAVPGSRNGIFIPEPCVHVDKIAYLPEGPTDTAALLAIGCYAIGRPTCFTGNDFIKAALKRLRIFRAVIVADNDEMKKVGAGESRPGIEGAKRLKAMLGIPTVIWIPPSPCKDAREFVRKGGTKAMIEADCKNKVWSKQ